ncbi:plasmid mobilization relaxosome protein MobC [Lactococcus lactis]|uniref:plasmid mobilization relaxosome protein MobC n=1 Tax=Lactococcus lactis TaxID=1358 RepID=UPI002891B58B|nr:plasmid mobilization relaxosome protein MobC [Lactococcus lactis]MDT2936452.1 plasmid mobilization relaxosome protein MobC [Lactococcus lactis]MDT2968980.1 plasmid mobilization relaxosome protein MobC [Lactococcus lactis]
MKKTKISVRIDTDKFEKYTTLAKQNDRSFSSEINRALSDKPNEKHINLDNEARSILIALETYVNDIRRSVKGRSNNINQLAKQVNSLKSLSDHNSDVIQQKIDDYNKSIAKEIEKIEHIKGALDDIWQ